MIKASRVLFILGIIVVLISCVSVYFTLSSGDKMMSQAGAFMQSDDLKAKLEQAKAQVSELKEHLPLHIGELALSLAAGVLGFIGTKMRARGAGFFTLEGLCLAFTALAFVSKSWVVGGLYLLALGLSFIKIMRLTKGGVVIPEDALDH
jgi:hypothetical protein